MADNLSVVGIEFDTATFERAVRRLEQRLDDLEREVDQVTQAARRQEDAFNNLGRRAIQLASAYGAFRILEQTGRFLFDTNVEFQQLEARLISITGSVEEAQDAFSMITEFAKSTPFEVQNLVEAFTLLEAVGITPTIEHLRDLGNFAAALGRDITDFASAVVRAATGETEALKGFGIVARSEGDRLRVTFRGVTHEVQRDFVPVVELFRQLGREHFAGAMDQQLRTIAGSLSNLQDSAASLAKEIGEQGLNGEISRFARTIDQAIQNGDEFARVMGRTLAAGVRGATEALEFFLAHTELVVTSLEVLTGAAVGNALAGLVGRLRAAAAAAGGLSAALSANPVGAILTLAGALAGPLVVSLLSSRDAAEMSAEELEELRGEVDKLEESLRGLGETELKQKLEELTTQYREAAAALNKAREEAEQAAAEREARAARMAFEHVTVGEAPAIALPTASVLSQLRDEEADAMVAELQKQVAALASAIVAAQRRLAELEKREAENAARAAERAAEAATEWTARLQEQRIALAEGERAALAFRLAQEGIEGATAEQILTLWDEVQALEAESKAKEEAKRKDEQRREAIERIVKGLSDEAAAIGKTRAELVRYQLEQLNADEAEIRRAEEAARRVEEFERRQKELEDERREAQARLEAEMNQLQSDADRMAEAFGDAFLEIIKGTKDVAEAFDDMVDSILADILRITIREAVSEPIAGFLGGILKTAAGVITGLVFGGGSGGRTGGGGSGSAPVPDAVFGGFAAEGANVRPGQAFIVGERGPELFIAGASGQIRPIEVLPIPPTLEIRRLAPSIEPGVPAQPAPAPTVTFAPRFSFDASRLPPARDPRQAARDADWVRFIGETLKEWEAAGGRLRTA